MYWKHWRCQIVSLQYLQEPKQPEWDQETIFYMIQFQPPSCPSRSAQYYTIPSFKSNSCTPSNLEGHNEFLHPVEGKLRWIHLHIIPVSASQTWMLPSSDLMILDPSGENATKSKWPCRSMSITLVLASQTRMLLSSDSTILDPLGENATESKWPRRNMSIMPMLATADIKYCVTQTDNHWAQIPHL